MLVTEKTINTSRKPFTKCPITNQLRLTFTNTDKTYFKIYPCCKYEWIYIDKPLGKIYFKDLPNIDLFKTLSDMRNNNHLYNDVFLNCCLYYEGKENLKNYYCNWAEMPLDTISVALLETCNYNCIMCTYDHRIDKEQAENYFYVLEQLKGHNLKGLELTQVGEPFFYKKRTMDYLKSLTNNDFKYIEIITNGSLLDDKDIEELAEINKTIKIFIVMSVDGITKNTYESIRRNGNFERVMSNAIKLKQHDMLKFIHYVVMEENKSELMEAYEYWTNVVGVQFVTLPKEQNYQEIYNSPEYQHYLKVIAQK